MARHALVYHFIGSANDWKLFPPSYIFTLCREKKLAGKTVLNENGIIVFSIKLTVGFYHRVSLIQNGTMFCCFGCGKVSMIRFVGTKVSGVKIE